MFWTIINLLVSLALPFIACCPRKEDIRPCNCLDRRHFIDITCTGLADEYAVYAVARHLKGFHNIERFRVEDSVFQYIPHNTFNDIKILDLEIDKSTLLSISDHSMAFGGLEEHLKALTITNSSLYSNWDWTKIEKLTSVIMLTIADCDLEDIDESFLKISHLPLMILDFHGNKIIWIHEKAFQKFRRLSKLDLSHNRIEVIKKSMMPNPAEYLLEINLSYNRIRQLPDGLFNDMPRIYNILIQHNQILTLTEGTFSHAWTRLNVIDVRGNKVRCDCRLSWMTKKKFPKIVLINCDQPSYLRGRNVITLKEKDLWCF